VTSARGWAIAAVALCAAVAQHPDISQRVPIYVAAATIAAVFGAALAFPPLKWHDDVTDPGPEHGPHLGLAAGIIAGSSAVAEMIWRLEPFQLTHQFTHTASTCGALLWLAGLIAGIGLLWHEGLTPRPACHDTSSETRRRWVWIALLLILAASATLRLWHLAMLPEGIWSDEVDSAADSMRLLHLPFQPFPPGNFGHNPCLYFYVMAALIWIGGNGVETIRLASALFGIAAVGVAFVLGYQLRGASLGLIACALMGMAQWAITFSRVAMPDIPIPAITGLGYAAFFVAMRRPRAFWFALSGAMLGLSFLTYPGAYLPALVPIFVLLARCRADLSFGRMSWPGRLFLPLCLAASAAPFLTTLMLDGNFVLLRIHVTSLYNEYHNLPHRVSGLLDNLRTYALMFTVQGDENGRHNLSGAPMLDPIMGAMFLFGLGICIRTGKHWVSQTLLLWTAANMLSGILSVDYEAPHAARTLGTLAPIVIITGLPLLYLPQAISAVACWASQSHVLHPVPSLRASTKPPVTASAGAEWTAPALLLAILTLLGALALNLHQYFWKQADSLASWTAMGGRVTIVGRAIDRYQREGYDVFTAPSLANDSVVRFVAPTWTPQTYDAANPLRGLSMSHRVALIIPSGDSKELARIVHLDAAAHVTRLTPTFDPAALQAYVVTLEPRPTRAK
jgi:4-amino-4-deoxy-L-arabinose transferase-like glycosyltransferase